MAYPYEITANRGITEFPTLPQDAATHSNPPPVYYNGYLIQILHDATYAPDRIMAWVSDVTVGDPGSTWTHADSANDPTINNTANRVTIDVAQSGQYLYVTHLNGSFNIVVDKFDMNSRTWGTQITGGPASAYYTDDGSFDHTIFKTVILSNGDIFIAYIVTKTVGTNFAETRGVIYDVSVPSWGTPFSIFEPDVTETTILRGYLLRDAILGASDRVHIISDLEKEIPLGIIHRTYTGSLNDVRIEYDYGQLRNDSMNATRGVQFTFCGITWICKAFAQEFDDTQNGANDGVRRLACLMWPDEDEPTNWRLDIIHTINDFFDSGSPWLGASLAVNGNTLYYIYGDYVAANHWVIKHMCLKQTKWAGPTTIYDPGSGAANEITDIAANFVNGQLGITFEGFDTAFTAPYYYQLSPTCGAVSCGSGASINRAYVG